MMAGTLVIRLGAARTEVKSVSDRADRNRSDNKLYQRAAIFTLVKEVSTTASWTHSPTTCAGSPMM